MALLRRSDRQCSRAQTRSAFQESASRSLSETKVLHPTLWPMNIPHDAQISFSSRAQIMG